MTLLLDSDKVIVGQAAPIKSVRNFEIPRVRLKFSMSYNNYKIGAPIFKRNHYGMQ